MLLFVFQSAFPEHFEIIRDGPENCNESKWRVKWQYVYVLVFWNTKNIKIKIYRTIVLAVVLYGCETWSLTLREERRLRVFENRVLR